MRYLRANPRGIKDFSGKNYRRQDSNLHPKSGF